MGLEGIRGIEAQHVPGYRLRVQIEGYVTCPTIMVLVSTIPLMVLSKTRWAAIGIGWAVISLLLVLPYLFVYGGRA